MENNVSMDYAVSLEAYEGPLDLLLYLIRKNEVDVFNIPIATITDQYMEYLTRGQLLDPNIAGDFLVMASTLMEIKSRMMVPLTGLDEEEEMEDPRSFLVQQLLAYKKFKEASDKLGQLRQEHSLRIPKPISSFRNVGDDADKGVALTELSISDLQDAFRRMVRETMMNLPETFVYDDTSIHEHADRIMNRLAEHRRVTFRELATDKNPVQMVGIFISILELLRQQKIRVVQAGQFDEIWVYSVDESEVPLPESVGNQLDVT